MPGVICTSDAGARRLNGYMAILDAASACPPGRMKTLFDATPVRLHGSFSVPTLDVQPLSITVDGIVPFMIPHRILSFS